MVLVERRPVAGVDAEALAADHLVGGELAGDLGVLDDLAQLLPHELGGQVVGLPCRAAGRCRRRGTRRPPLLPAPLELGPALLVAHLEGGLRRCAPCGPRSRVGMRRFSARNSAYSALISFTVDRVERLVPRRHGEGGGALEHRELGGLLGDDRDRLDGRRARADHADALPGEVDALVGPLAGVVGRARRRTSAPGMSGVLAALRQPVAMTTKRAVTSSPWSVLHPPGAGRVVEGGRGHLGLELDVPAQVEAIGDVVGVRRGSRAAGRSARVHSHSCCRSSSNP